MCVLLDMNDDQVTLHDPWGFPYVFLSLAELEAAWRADLVQYKGGYFRHWHAPQRVRTPSDDTVYGEALEQFRSSYHESDRISAKQQILVGADAIQEVAGRARHRILPRAALEHLRLFALRLGASRAIDFARFFARRDPELASLKHRQAMLFGRAHVMAVQDSFRGLSDALMELAKP